jgi:hypothetical protein
VKAPASGQLIGQNCQRHHSSKKAAISFIYLPRYNPAMMRWCLFNTPVSPERATSELLERIQHLETEQAELRSRLQGLAAAQAAIVISKSDAPDVLSHSATTPKRGRAGGLARAGQVARLRERWLGSGRFMAHVDREEIEEEVAKSEYMRYAAGGFARAASARRAPDGTFES